MKDVFKSAMASIKPYVDVDRFKPFNGATELVLGVRAIRAYGHSPGHNIESEGQQLAVWATWSEFGSKRALPQRLKHFADAAKKGYYVALAHVAFPGIGRLRAERLRS